MFATRISHRLLRPVVRSPGAPTLSAAVTVLLATTSFATRATDALMCQPLHSNAPTARSDQLIPVTVGFLYYKYRFRGTKATGEKYTSGWVTVAKDDLYQYFEGGDQTVWYRLE
ncbi:hypothetical protein BGZ82_000530, partial [Podila clonocystis]